jgi:RHS repeat-associated protein
LVNRGQSNQNGFSSSVVDLVISNTYTYDHMGRKKKSWQQIGVGNPNVLVSELEYSETGQLLHKKLHGNLQDISYRYNERGWLDSLGSSLFSQTLRYANPRHGATAQYNGNISEQGYTAAISGAQQVTYGYDAMNRLTDGVSSAGYSETGISYDKMGNLLGLTRAGLGSLSYDLYEGNQLKTLSGYKSGTFSYNANGNMETDGMRGINIGYNSLNLPASITGNQTITYTYDATGRKLRKVSNTTGTSDYVDVIHYENNALAFIQTEEGRAIKSGADYNYEYTLKDHLGNNRVSFDTWNGTANKVGENDYYPFGLNKVVQANAGNKYLYNGKELQEELGQLDYGARFYDPEIGRWTTVDPSADEEDQESWTPYHYVLNNPIKNTDPDGRTPITGLIGAALGAVIGGGIEVGMQLYDHGEVKDWGAVGGATIQGGITGGVAGLTGGASLLATVGASAGANALGGAANNLIQGKKITVVSVAKDVVVGAVAGVGGKLLDKAGGKIASKYDASITGKNSVRNVKTNVTGKEFGKNLEKSGFSKEVSKDGKAATYTKGDSKYSVRNNQSGKGTKGSSADYSKGSQKPTVKIRLNDKK